MWKINIIENHVTSVAPEGMTVLELVRQGRYPHK